MWFLRTDYSFTFLHIAVLFLKHLTIPNCSVCSIGNVLSDSWFHVQVGPVDDVSDIPQTMHIVKHGMQWIGLLVEKV